MAEVALHQVVKKYGDVEAVRAIDLDIPDNEFVVLVGPSGCGKSTTLRMIAGLEEVTSGNISIGGEVVNAGYDIDLQTACLLERDAFALCFSSFDQREGMQSFLDKRQPRFKGE